MYLLLVSCESTIKEKRQRVSVSKMLESLAAKWGLLFCRINSSRTSCFTLSILLLRAICHLTVMLLEQTDSTLPCENTFRQNEQKQNKKFEQENSKRRRTDQSRKWQTRKLNNLSEICFNEFHSSKLVVPFSDQFHFRIIKIWLYWEQGRLLGFSRQSKHNFKHQN